MNKVCLCGRLTSTPELRYNNSNKAYTRFNLAVNRNFTNQNGEREADFISCVAWEKKAETICNYLTKGSQIGVEGRIQTGSYERDDGTRTYTTDIIAEDITFLESKKDSRPEPQYTGQITPEDVVRNRNVSPYDYQQSQMNVDPYGDFGDSIAIDDNFLD